MNLENENDVSDRLAAELTAQLVGLQSLAADDVVLASMTAALNVACDVLPLQEVSAWLRRLADTIDKYDPATDEDAN